MCQSSLFWYVIGLVLLSSSLAIAAEGDGRAMREHCFWYRVALDYLSWARSAQNKG